MVDTVQRAPVAPSTEDGFLSDRLSFWGSVTKFMTRIAIGLFVLLAMLWWFLV